MGRGTAAGVRQMLKRTGAGFFLGLGLSGCAATGPLFDQDMSDAPHQACIDLAGAPAPDAPACFLLVSQGSDGARTAWAGGAVAPGRTLVAVHRGGPGCDGTFTHLTVAGAAPGPGRMELATWDVHARPGHSRTVRWEQGFASREYSLADIGSTLMNPAGARITVQEGAFDPRRICFKSY